MCRIQTSPKLCQEQSEAHWRRECSLWTVSDRGLVVPRLSGSVFSNRATGMRHRWEPEERDWQEGAGTGMPLYEWVVRPHGECGTLF